MGKTSTQLTEWVNFEHLQLPHIFSAKSKCQKFFNSPLPARLEKPLSLPV
jgi:hypothetical protein